MVLKNKNEIEDYEMKAKFLVENGWLTYFNDDNWIKRDWIRQGLNYDYMGFGTDQAYKDLKKFSKQEEYSFQFQNMEIEPEKEIPSVVKYFGDEVPNQDSENPLDF